MALDARIIESAHRVSFQKWWHRPVVDLACR